MKIVGLLTKTFLLSLLMIQPTDAELLFDRGLPARPINESNESRSNLRWTAGFDNSAFYGDDFTIGEPGEQYLINHVRTWAVLGYREDGPSEPAEVGDWFSHLRLRGGLPADQQLPVLASGSLDVGTSATNNPSVVISRATYPDGAASSYENFGRFTAIWQIDFYNLNWVVEGGRRYNFSVQGIGRPMAGHDSFHAWYNHATSAQFESVPQQGADDLMVVFSSTGEFVRVAEAEESWIRPTDINVQIFGDRLLATGDASTELIDRPELAATAQALHEQGLLGDRAYQRLRIEIEQGAVNRKSRLLEAVSQRPVEASNANTVDILLNELPNVPNIETLSRSELETLFTELMGELSRVPNVALQSEATLANLEHLSDEQLRTTVNAFYGLNEYLSSGGIPSDPSVPGNQRQQALEQLNDTGILDERVYQALGEAIASRQIYYLTDLYERATQYTRALENLQPPYVNDRLDALRQAGILSEQNQARLLSVIDTPAIQSELDFLNYVDQAVILDLENYAISDYGEIFERLPRIYQTVADRLVSAGIFEDDFGLITAESTGTTSLTGRLNVPDVAQTLPRVASNDFYEGYEVIVTARYGDRLYQQMSEDVDILGALENFRPDYYRVNRSPFGLTDFFNQILRDQVSPYRIYVDIHLNTENFELEGKRVGIVALQDNQTEVYFGRLGPWAVQQLDNSELTSSKIEEIISIAEQSGLFDHLNHEQIAAAKIQISRQYISSLHELFHKFDGILYVPFESGIEAEDTYQELALGLASISRGAFQPTSLEVVFDPETEAERFSFTLNGQRFSRTFQQHDDWEPYGDALSFLLSVAAETVAEGHFYTFEESGQGFLFLSSAQHEALQANELIELELAR